MEFDITKMVETISTQARENQEEFIFETIQPYCENILQIKINKKELEQILLRGMQKQQTCDDCISRTEALKAIEKEKQGWEGAERYAIDECHTRIAELPSVTPQQTRWIPVKWHIKTKVEEYEQYPEGVVMFDCPMPKEGEDVLVTIKGKDDYRWVKRDIAVQNEGEWYTDSGYNWVDVIAWMPFPKVYKEVEE